jgi:hypothetical protein
MRDLSEFTIHQRYQLAERLRIAITPGLQQVGNLMGTGHLFLIKVQTDCTQVKLGLILGGSQPFSRELKDTACKSRQVLKTAGSRPTQRDSRTPTILP